MATVQYNMNTQLVDTVNFTGSNFDEIVAFAGIANVKIEDGKLYVYGNEMAVNDRVAKNAVGGAPHKGGKIASSKLATDYTAA